jgi:hypothetical protein
VTGCSIRATVVALAAGVVLVVAPNALANGPKSDNGSGNGKGASAAQKAQGPPSSPKGPTAPVPAPAPAGAGTQHVDGVVQAVIPALVVVKQLDGSAVSVPYDKRTRISVNGKIVKIGEVKAGEVLDASWMAGKPATTLRFLRTG